MDDPAASTPPTEGSGRTSSATALQARHARLTVLALCFGGLSVAITQTLVIPIQQDLPRLLGSTAADTGWVVTITLFTGAVSMPVSGRLGDIYGRPRIVIANAAMLALGSLVCALSSSLLPILVGRGLQGLAMGFIPVGIALVRDVTPPRMTGTAIAVMSSTMGVGAAIGLPLSAVIAEAFSWHALFWMSTAVAGLLLIALLAFLPRGTTTGGGSVDVIGALLLAIGVVSLLLGISKGHQWGWTSGSTLGCVTGGLVVLILWGAFEVRQREPLVDLRSTARRPVLFTNLAAFAVGFGMMTQSIVVPQLLQLPASTGHGMGQSMLATGLWMAPSGLMMMLFAPVSSRLMRDVGAKHTLMIGAVVIGAGYLIALFLMSSPWQMMLATCIATAGVGIGYAAMPTLIMNNVEAEAAGSAVGVNALGRSMGTTCAAATMAMVLASSTTASGVPTRSGYELCFLIGATASFAAALIVLLVPRADAASSSALRRKGLTRVER
ncbi:MFS transporter [Streptomyces muensis]|uniref:MFS transporter n=1 Tax=Streptomyces muensis TaxID=1077944 RepID=A0A9X1TQ83_STRM4|nr:MFS transporter [Streptomyces muensis]MCF1592333.1 MFS transporter [Streptomyces muensis]